MMRLHSLETHMGDHRIALVAPTHQHHRRPEIAHPGEVRPPILADDPREHRPDQRVGSHPGIEGMDEPRDHRFVHTRFIGHRLGDAGAAFGGCVVGHGSKEVYFIPIMAR